MSMKKSLLSTLLASLTLMSLAACNGGQSQLEQVPSENVSAPVEQGVGIASTGSKYKLNLKIDMKNSLKPGTIKNALSTKKVDLRSNAPQVYDQGNLGSCTAFAIAKGLREHLAKKAGNHQPLSALFFYYEERKLDGNVTEDSGSSINTGMEVLKDTGVATEATWPYDTAKFTQEPPSAAYASAGQFKVKSTQQIKTFGEWRTALEKGQPVAFGIPVYESFMKSKGGVIPMPAAGEKMLGGHAIVSFGYDDEKEVIIVRNSWSAKWGDGGYCYIPYGYLSKGYIMQPWTAN
ncbi:MAG: C1 family peptidase [Candidatus Sericytochromatia bacterium]